MLEAKIKHGTLILGFAAETTLDIENAGTFFHEAAGHSAQLPRVVLDLANLDFIDSAGLRHFVLLQRLLRQRGGTLALARARPHVREIFEVTRLAQALPIYGDVLTAARMLSGEGSHVAEADRPSPRVEVRPVSRGEWLKVMGTSHLAAENLFPLLRELDRSSRRCAVHVLDLRFVESLDSSALSQLYGAFARDQQAGVQLYVLASTRLAAVLLAQVNEWRGYILTDPKQALAQLSGNLPPKVTRVETPQPSEEFPDIHMLLSERQK
jgi:anti-anti-sigma factor